MAMRAVGWCATLDAPMTVLKLPSAFAGEIVAAWSLGGRWHGLFQGLMANGEIPDAPTLGMLLDVVFYASLIKEEGRLARFSIAITRPTPIGAHSIMRKPLTPEVLGKLSAACDWDSTLLLAWPFAETLDAWQIWGIAVNDRPQSRSSTVQSSDNHLIITARDSGSLSLRWRHEVLFSYANGRGAVADKNALHSDQITSIVAESLPPQTRTTLRMVNLSAIYRSMRAHGRGGALLVVPTIAPAEIKFSYEMAPWPAHVLAGQPFFEAPLANAVLYEEKNREWREPPPCEDPTFRSTRENLYRSSIEQTEAEAALIGRLTAIDGIVVLNHEMTVLGIGGKIPVPDDFSTTAVLHIDPRDGTRIQATVKETFHGMRHNSAAMACRKCGPGAVALVQSQDGALTVIIHRDDGALWVIRPLERLVSYYER
jgi:hypothetical protein